jgi:hypothetical protein
MNEIREVFEEVLRLQRSWSSSNSPDMQRRGELIRTEARRHLAGILDGLTAGFQTVDWAVEGRDGTGLKTRVPWVRVYSRSKAPTATAGWYVVYLFSFDGSSVVLSLNQGTTVPGEFTMRSPEQLKARVDWARSVIAADHEVGDLRPDISLADPGKLGEGYEYGNVYAVHYAAGAVPADDTLSADLRRLLELLDVIYATPGEPTWGTSDHPDAPATSRPPLADLPAFIAWVRERYGESLVPSRAAAEQDAREFLDAHAGSMTREQALSLGELFNRGEWGGVARRNRFLPAFAGATMEKLVDPLERFNEVTGRLWRDSETEALGLVDEILKDPSRMTGAGRSYPTMLMYLRDPSRFFIWLTITHKGLAGVGRFDESRSRSGGADRYRAYCEAARTFLDDFGLAPQELDAVLSEIARASIRESASTEAEIASIVEEPEDDREHADQAATDYPLSHVAAATHLPLELLEEWAALLSGEKKQALFFGPPGTGKTFVARHLARYLAGSRGEVKLVQFHPSFSYEDFMEGLRPAASASGSVSYEVRPGIFRLFCERARGSDGTFVFIIDEINRAELGAVLGELMMLLEYRDLRVPLPYSQEQFSVPPNVVVLATMNTADRSLALVDFALRRRFHAFAMKPDRGVLEKYFEARNEPESIALTLFDLIQERVNDPDFAPGHSYWMTDDATAQGLYRVWRYELYPYLAEYWFERRLALEEVDATVTALLSEEA